MTTTRETCNYYGNNGANLSTGFCQNEATWDIGRRIRPVGLTYSVRYSCEEHAARLVPFKMRRARANAIVARREATR